MIHAQVSNSSPVSTKAEKFSTFPCPYWCSASAGLSETRTEKKVRTEAIRSSPECAASERMPRLPVVMPTTILRLVMTNAATTEFPAAARFSARINSADGTAGLLDMHALSPLGAESDKPIERQPSLKRDNSMCSRAQARTLDCARISCLARSPSNESILEEMRYG